jgi:hypothetical protein
MVEMLVGVWRERDEFERKGAINRQEKKHLRRRHV